MELCVRFNLRTFASPVLFQHNGSCCVAARSYKRSRSRPGSGICSSFGVKAPTVILRCLHRTPFPNPKQLPHPQGSLRLNGGQLIAKLGILNVSLCCFFPNLFLSLRARQHDFLLCFVALLICRILNSKCSIKIYNQGS